MYVRMISFGTSWWAARDPERPRRQPAWFNSTGIRCGRRLRICSVLPGQIRFNQRSGFHPSFPLRAVGRTFFCDDPSVHDGRVHLLVRAPGGGCEPNAYLVTVTGGTHGRILFTDPQWRSQGVQPIAVSLRRDRYEAMLVLRRHDWIKSDLGIWKIHLDGRALCLVTDCDGVTSA